jgi:hypothetical protein
MNLIIKIAWRNIFRHKGKSMIIGAILFLGAVLMTVGNGIVTGMNYGMQKNMIEGFTGDIIIASDKQKTDDVLFNFTGKAIAPITNYSAIDKALKGVPFVADWLPIGKNPAIILNEEGGPPEGLFIVGVDFKRYRAFFGDNMRAVEGRLLKDNERGVLIGIGERNKVGRLSNVLFSCEGSPVDTSTLSADIKAEIGWMVPKTSLVFMGLNSDANAPTDIRLPITGIIKYRSLNTFWGMFPIMDIESYRECMGYFPAHDTTKAIDQHDKLLLSLNESELDNLFSKDALVENRIVGKNHLHLAEGSLSSKRDQTIVSGVDLNAGMFNLVLVRLNDGRHLKESVEKLTATLKDGNLRVRAIAWNKAVGTLGSMTLMIKGFLFAFVMVLFFVAIIVIVNIMIRCRESIRMRSNRFPIPQIRFSLRWAPNTFY